MRCFYSVSTVLDLTSNGRHEAGLCTFIAVLVLSLFTPISVQLFEQTSEHCSLQPLLQRTKLQTLFKLYAPCVFDTFLMKRAEVLSGASLSGNPANESSQSTQITLWLSLLRAAADWTSLLHLFLTVVQREWKM